MENSVELKTVNDILGMNFFIPSYQRGYRWETQQVIDLLEDINSFSQKTLRYEEIYCIQPLVVTQRDEDVLEKCKRPEATLDDIRRYIKGSWSVVDGQQRLTTIYLILKALNVEELFKIQYSTRKESEEFLNNIDPENQYKNIDFYHMYNAFITINKWIEAYKKKPDADIKTFCWTLLNRVVFIWYSIDKEEEIKVFKRLNIGKIPLTDSELIKALFINRTNFDTRNDKRALEIESMQKTIAFEWDMIEHELQNDEFWAFINNFDYSKPTRIDYILDTICNKNTFGLSETIGKDEHRTFRYFNELFNQKKGEGTDWVKQLWSTIKMYYQVFDEWYHDYQLYHYIGYLSTISFNTFDVSELVSNWNNNDKTSLLKELKETIKKNLESTKWLTELNDYKFDQVGKANKRECIGLLLLYNIETIIQQNNMLVKESKYNLPDFSKFPFHLYKKEKWEVEHIRPNAGDNFKNDDAKKIYLLLAKTYIIKDDVRKKIDSFLDGNNDALEFSDLLSEVVKEGGELSDEDKNKIWNYTLLDAKTNKEYGNQIFPVKRAFINNKVNGIKKKYKLDGNKLVEIEERKEVAFVPLCTQKVFSKSFTSMPSTMVNWNNEDAKAYLTDIIIKLKYYLPGSLIKWSENNE